MSSADRENEQAGKLIERLLVDPEFRAEFRRDPAAASVAAGLPELAAELEGSARAMDTLMIRESKSSLAGVVMAVAVEGMSIAEAQALIQHGPAGAPRGNLLHAASLRDPVAHLRHAASPAALPRELRGLHGGSPAHHLGGAASAAQPQPAAAAQSVAAPEPAAAPHPVAAPQPVAAAQPMPTPDPSAPPAAAAPAPLPADPGAQPAQGGVVPAWPDQPSAGGGAAGGGGGVAAAAGAVGSGAVGAVGAPGGLMALLESPRLSASPNVRTFLASGGADPRMVSVLDSALANHTIGLGQVEAVSDPAHVQAVDIVSVDGQPVGPNNFAARDLVTEIAALDPSARPDEIGTPWPIHSQGFFSDAGSANRLHLAFEMPGTDTPPTAGAQAAGAIAPPAAGAATPLAAGAPPAAGAAPPGAGQVAYPAPAASPEVQVSVGQPPAMSLDPTAPTAGVPLSSVVPAPVAAATPGSGVDAALAYAHAMIGKLPESAGSNLGPQLDKFEADFCYHGSPWCGIFAGHVLEAAGLKPPHSVAAVASILDLARNGDPPFLKGILPVSEARPGDLVTFGGTEHVAVVIKVDAAGVHTIAGNTGQSNVSATTYSPSSVTGVVRPDYAAGKPGSIPGVWDYPGVQPPAAVAEAPAGGAVSVAAGAQPPDHYVSPLPATARIGRTDMGVDVDLNPGDAIVAPGTSRVVGIMPNWYQGQPYVALQLLDGPMQGHNYYIAEQITPDVSVGQVVRQGQPIGHFAASGTGIEMGWAGSGSNWEQTLAQETGHDNADMGDHANTPAGVSFRNFLNELGHGGSSSAAGPTDPADLSESSAPSAAPDAAGSGSAAPQVPSAPATPAPAPVQADASLPQAISAPAPEPAPAAFNAHALRGSGRHTVQFLPAVQPSPGSPLYGQAPPAAQPVVAQAPAEAVQPLSSATPASTAAAAPAPVTGGLLDQAAGATPTTGGSISVSSSLLTPGQAKFAGRLAELTGLDPHVVAAWELAEESGSAAQGREAASNFNWLNIGYFDSGAGKIAFDKTFGDPISAAEQTAKFLKGDWGGASSSIRAILSTVGHSTDEQMSAIANSDWASSHYGGGANLHGTYNELGDIHIEKSPVA